MGVAMHNDGDAILDDLLCRWAQWNPGHVGRGFNDRATVTGDYYRTSRQYDDANGALDDDIEDAKMAAIDFQVSEMATLHQYALRENAQALVVGCWVFLNPRLPADRPARQALVDEARRRLAERLMNCGVL